MQKFSEISFAPVQMLIFDFDGVFTDNTVYTAENGKETVRCWRSDGLGISRLKTLGIKLIIVSTEKNPVVSARAAKLGLPCHQSVENKATSVLKLCDTYGIQPADVLFLGNDINDIPAFELVGFPVAVRDAYPEVLPHVRYRTLKRGGHGAVREICDLVFHAKAAIAGHAHES